MNEIETLAAPWMEPAVAAIDDATQLQNSHAYALIEPHRLAFQLTNTILDTLRDYRRRGQTWKASLIFMDGAPPWALFERTD